MSELKKLAEFCTKIAIVSRIGFKYPGLFKKKINFDPTDIVGITPGKKVLKDKIEAKPASLWDKYTDSWNKNPMATGAATVGGLMVGDRILK